MKTLTSGQVDLLVQLIDFAWRKGGVISPVMADEIEALRRALQSKPDETEKD